MLMQSNLDEIVPREQSLQFCEALVECGVSVEMHLFDRVPHMFDGGKRLGRQAAAMVTSFLDRYLPDPERP
jgi:dipeptidyl aminopeptidase/acylaminoacyl peptidase